MASRGILTPLLAILVSCSKAADPLNTCPDQYSTTSSVTLQGQSQDFDKYPPPYKFSFADSLGRVTTEYTEDVHTIRLSGDAPFRSFVIQARLATQQGFIIGHLTAGQFIEESRWELQGIRFQPCPNAANSSITNSNADEKYSVEAKWQTLKKEGPIQFVITIFQTEDTFWTLWQPQSGFVVPSKYARFPTQAPTTQESPDTSPALFEGTEGSGEDSIGDIKRVILRPVVPADRDEEPLVPRFNRFNISLGADNRFSIRVVNPEEAKKDNKFPIPSILRGENGKFPDPPAFNMSNAEKAGSFDDDEETQANNVQAEVAESVATTSEAVSQKLKTPTTTPPQLPLCDSALCNYNGTCRGFPKQNRYLCICTEEWTGQYCDEPNFCYKHKCENGATCVSSPDGTYTCECEGEWAGELCERPCPAYLCQNGGNCTISKDGEYGCNCPEGYSGKHCEIDVDDCANSRCQNGGSCVDKLNGFECHCAPGFMGERCHRPCQDIYKSCEFWEEQDRCDSMRPTTKFFDINCAVTCGQCEFDNSTVKTNIPLPPLLEPLDFLLGKWTVNSSSSTHRFPLDFTNATAGYFETIEFAPAPVNMLGNPSISFSARAYSIRDPTDEQISVGFITVGAGSKTVKVSLMHTGNDGMTIMEEGVIEENQQLSLEMVYLVPSPGVEDIAPVEARRRLAIKAGYLQETVERNGTKGLSDSFTKYFFRETGFSY